MPETPEAPSQPLPPAGWYEYDGGRKRWWDGKAWGAFEDQPPTAPVDAPPPEDVSQGWKRDPLNAQKLRWWDGNTWTQRTGASKTVLVPPGTDTSALTLKTPEERKAALAQRLQYLVNVDRARVESQTDYQAVVVKGKKTNHILHLILTIVTFGLWAIVWLLVYAFGGEHRWMVSVNEYGQVLG